MIIRAGEDIKKMERFDKFLAGLDEPQVRALSSQCGLRNWHTASVERLLGCLAIDKSAFAKFKEVYG